MTNPRELNPQLFGTSTTVEKIGHPLDPNQPAAGIMGREPAPPQRQVPYPAIDLKVIEHQLAVLKVAMIQLDKRAEGLASKSEEASRRTHQRLERFAQAIQRVEETQSHHHQENTAKFAQMSSRVNESRIQDAKVSELMDRHNQVIRNFENRLLSLQRLISEQEMSLHNSQAALEEARNEIARLKRNASLARVFGSKSLIVPPKRLSKPRVDRRALFGRERLPFVSKTDLPLQSHSA